MIELREEIKSLSQLKEEIKELIIQEEDIKILEEVKSMLAQKHPDPVMKEWMTERALKAEEDIKEGRVYTAEEVRERIFSRLKK
jgi:CO dehydrogenase/acetyl-CoA synthase beta subunit